MEYSGELGKGVSETNGKFSFTIITYLNIIKETIGKSPGWRKPTIKTQQQIQLKRGEDPIKYSHPC